MIPIKELQPTPVDILRESKKTLISNFDPADEKKARYMSETNGKKVYLCSEMCKNQFDAIRQNMATNNIMMAGFGMNLDKDARIN
jgi:YHS domain-containing protein